MRAASVCWRTFGLFWAQRRAQTQTQTSAPRRWIESESPSIYSADCSHCGRRRSLDQTLACAKLAYPRAAGPERAFPSGAPSRTVLGAPVARGEPRALARVGWRQRVEGQPEGRPARQTAAAETSGRVAPPLPTRAPPTRSSAAWSRAGERWQSSKATRLSQISARTKLTFMSKSSELVDGGAGAERLSDGHQAERRASPCLAPGSPAG